MTDELNKKQLVDDFLQIPKWNHQAVREKTEFWLDMAKEATNGDARRDYEHPLINLLRIALKWSVTADALINPIQAALMMVDLKTCRALGHLKPDNYIDMMGYARLVEQMDDGLRILGYDEGAEYLTGISFEEMWNLLKLAQEKLPKPV